MINSLSLTYLRGIQINDPRHRDETLKTLSNFWSLVQVPGSRTEIQTLRTSTGIKDTYQHHFLNLVLNATYKHKGTIPEKQNLINAALSKIPENPIGPMWNIKGMLSFLTQYLHC